MAKYKTIYELQVGSRSVFIQQNSEPTEDDPEFMIGVGDDSTCSFQGVNMHKEDIIQLKNTLDNLIL